MADRRPIFVFLDHDLFGVLIANGVIPRLIAQGYDPVIYNGRNGRNTTPRVPHPDLSKLFNNGLLDRVILPCLDAQDPRDLRALSPARLAATHGVGYVEIGDPNHADIPAQVAACGAAYAGAVSFRFSQVFRAPLVAFIQQQGFFWNMHSGLLPEYKGLLTLYPAFWDGATHYGMTLHEMAVGIDAGAVIDQVKRPFTPHTPVFDLYLATVPGAIDMLTHHTALMQRQGTTRRCPQTGDPAAGYYTNPTTQEFNRAAQAGLIYADVARMPRLLANLFAKGGTPAHRTLEQRLTSDLRPHQNDPRLKLPQTHRTPQCVA